MIAFAIIVAVPWLIGAALLVLFHLLDKLGVRP